VIEIRPATAADADAMAALRWEFRSEQNPPVEPHDAFAQRCTAWMRRELQGGVWKAWVAVDDQLIVGQVWVQTIQKIPNPVAESEQLAYLSNLYVNPSARGGVGTRLLRAAIDWCRATGVDRIVLWPSARSVTLYLSHGFATDRGVMDVKM
jgi:GNAT superfamily N-acetyltransferase